MLKILVADDEANARYGMLKALRSEGRILIEAENGRTAIEAIRNEQPQLVFLDLNMPILDGLEVLRSIRADGSQIRPEIIVVTAHDSVEQAVECIRQGAADFISKPFEIEQLRAIARRTEDRVRLQTSVKQLERQLHASKGMGSILGISQPMRRLYDLIQRAAASPLPVLIRGESGTGKELVARELHLHSSRCAQPFVAVNTAAITESLIESELFGHVKGAFTGADRDREGVFRKADGGTLFLDEIGDMPYPVQTRLLRVLQEGVVQPVGSEKLYRVDVRILSATHQDLEQAIEDKLFRQDLYFRLCGIELRLPTLRARHEDILFLANHFLSGTASLSDETVGAMLSHPWPGNVRELKQRIESAVAMRDCDVLSPSDLGLVASVDTAHEDRFAPYVEMSLTEGRERLLADFERSSIQRALALENGNISAAARRLGIHRQSLQQKIRSLGLKV